ncbi:MAG: PLP-dependent aminotransferase family protein [Clostridia bacterium]
MEYKLADKIKNTGTSGIRIAMERTALIPECISFGIGNPAPEAIPTEKILNSIRKVIEGDPMKILQYGSGFGFQPLVDHTLNHLINDLNLPKEDNSLTLINGSGHGLGLLPRVLCDAGDVVFADEFTFPNGVNAAKANGAIIESIKMDKFGMIPEELEKSAKKGKGKYIYLIPNFHNPTGITIPLERRKELYEIARKYDLVIYEDDPYGEIRFTGERVPSFKSFDTDNRVIFAGSYSKVMSAGIRVGYLYGPTKLIQVINDVKGCSDGGSAFLNQMTVSFTLDQVEYAPYIQNICDIYGKKCKILTDSIKEYCSDKFTFIEPEGGMFLWLDAPKDLDIEAFFDKCLENKVCVLPSSGFATSSNNGHSFRLNFTALSDDKIVEGIKRLGKVTHEF